MSGGGGKGGQQTSSTTVKLPKSIEQASKENWGMAKDVASLGYVPYQGNTVAAFTPMQTAAMQNTNNAAAAFGMGSGASMAGAGVDPITGMTRQPTADANGVLGYSPYAGYLEAQSKIAPGQRAMIDSFFIDPMSGAAGNRTQQQQPAASNRRLGGGGKGGMQDGWRPTRAPSSQEDFDMMGSFFNRLGG